MLSPISTGFDLSFFTVFIQLENKTFSTDSARIVITETEKRLNGQPLEGNDKQWYEKQIEMH